MKKAATNGKTVHRRPALTPETRENQLIAMAMDLVEQRLADGTASSQETTHFLKLGSQKYRLEREKLEFENKLIQAKTKAIEEEKNMAVLYEKAIKAMQRYGGHGDTGDYDEDEDY